MDDAQLDDIISRLLEVRHSRAGKPVQLTEAEIRALCITARDIFMQQVRRERRQIHERGRRGNSRCSGHLSRGASPQQVCRDCAKKAVRGRN